MKGIVVYAAHCKGPGPRKLNLWVVQMELCEEATPYLTCKGAGPGNVDILVVQMALCEEATPELTKCLHRPHPLPKKRQNEEECGVPPPP